MAFAYSDSESKQWAREGGRGREREGGRAALRRTPSSHFFFLQLQLQLQVVVPHSGYCYRPLRSWQLLISKKRKGGGDSNFFFLPNLNSNSCLNYVRSEQVRKQVVCAVCPFVAPRAVDSSNLWEHYSISDSQRQDGEAPAEPEALFMEFRDKTRGGKFFFLISNQNIGNNLYR